MIGSKELREMSQIQLYSSVPEERRDQGANITIRWQQDEFQEFLRLDCETLSAAYALVYCHF